MRQYLIESSSKTTRDEGGERDRLYLEAQRARARGPRAGPASPVRRLALLLFRRTTA